MIARQLKALMWKDLRVNRLIIVFYFIGAAILTGAAIIILYCILPAPGQPNAPYRSTTQYFGETFTLLMGLTCLMAAMLGANSASAERVDRSDAFLAYLPPSRRLVLFSRLAAGLGLTLGLAAFNLLLIALTYSIGDQHPSRYELRGVESFLVAAWVLFAVSWGAAACIGSSVAIGMVIGLLFPGMLWMSFMNTGWLWGLHGDLAYVTCEAAEVGLGLVALACGYVVAMKRQNSL